MAFDESGAPTAAQPVYNQATGQLEVPSSTVTAFPHRTDGTSRKIVDPNAVAAQGELAQARQSQLAAEESPIPINNLPDDLLSPDELQQRWEGGINETIPSQTPGEAPLTMPGEGGEMAPQTLNRAEFQDRVNRYKAVQAKAMEEKLQRDQVERQAAYDRQLQQQMEAFHEAKAEAARMASPEVLFSKPSFGHRMMEGIAMALGAYGATMGRTDNFAMKIIQAKQDEDMQLKKLALDGAIKKAERAGASVEQVMKLREDGMKRIKENRIEQGHWLDAKIGDMQALWPAEQQKLAKLRADLQAETAKDTRNFFAEHGGQTKTGTQYSTAVTKTEGSTTQRQPMGVSDAEAKKATYGTQILDAVGVIEKGRRLTDDELKLMNENVMGMRAAAENATKGLSGPARVRALRALGLSPDSLTDGMDPEAKRIANAMMVGSGLIIRDQSGAAITNFEDLNNAMQRLPQVGDTDEIYADKVGGLRKYGESLVKLSGPVAQQRLGITPEGKAKTKDDAKPRTAKEGAARLSAEDRAALKWINDNPKDPRSKAIRKRLMAKMTGGE